MVMGSPLGEVLGPLAFTGFEGIDVSESQDFRNQGYTKNEMDSVRLSSIALSISAPDDGNFDFFTRLSFFAEADGLPKVEVARLDPIPKGSQSIDMDILDVELVDYASADSMTITSTATGTSPSQNTIIDARVVLDIDVNIDGALGCQVPN